MQKKNLAYAVSFGCHNSAEVWNKMTIQRSKTVEAMHYFEHRCGRHVPNHLNLAIVHTDSRSINLIAQE